MSSSCTTSIPDKEEEDRLNLVVQDGYYGYANRKRGETDARQCVWRSAYEASDFDYTAPLAIMPASSNGIIEFESDAFEGQMRGDLIGKLSTSRRSCFVHRSAYLATSFLSDYFLFNCPQWGNTRMSFTGSFCLRTATRSPTTHLFCTETEALT